MSIVDFSGKPFHFVGVGGIGMSALAYILAQRQIPTSGSDLRKSHITERLERVGVNVFNRQEKTNLDYFINKVEGTIPVVANPPRPLPTQPSLPQVVVSTAISSSNAEYQAAKEQGCPIYHRSDILAALIKESKGIAVAGTHGKTTTSSLISHVLLEAGLDPTVIIGGEIEAIKGNAYLGQGEYLVAEADESDGSLVKHCPKIGVITNIELDHPDHYKTLAEVVDIFRTFVLNSEILVGCLDCETIKQTFVPDITYSLNPKTNADYIATNIIYHSHGIQAEVWEKGKNLGIMELNLLGEHNISNALATVAVARKLGVDFSIIADALATFKGAKRRFEVRGESNGVTFVDDYAHHPTELQVTLASARQKINQKDFYRVVAVFQPHRYTRTATFLEDFASVFDHADVVIVTDIYSAGESNPHQLSGQQVVDVIKTQHNQVYYQPVLGNIPEFLAEILQPGDLTLFLGAGNLNQKIPESILAYSNSCVQDLAKAG
ncbi:MAG: UDP-N-acetylmuramate--L-alanine ligase [Microcystaceae cyanobacterium]